MSDRSLAQGLCTRPRYHNGVSMDSGLNDVVARLLIENAPDGILLCDADGRIIYVNSVCEKLFGYDGSDLLGEPVEVLLPERFRKKHVQDRREYAANPHFRPMTDDKALTGRRKDSTEFPVQVSLGPVLTSVGLSVLCIIRDATRLRQAEEKLLQIQKMEAIGQLAGGIAHDFNNLLTVITGYGETLLGSLEAGDAARPPISEIVKAAQRAADLTRQLLAFSRKQILQPSVLNLNELVTDFQNMLVRLIGEDICLVTELSPALGQVKVDRGQIEQVLLNLAVNARDAMPRGGTLTIETRNAGLSESCETSEVRTGLYALLRVSDTGFGMTPETLARIFEPFFTTKPMGKGAGLGLATVYGIIQQSGGHIRVQSRQGQGTTFNIYLPICDQPIGKPKTNPDVRGGKETVLLVEDEDGVRGVTRCTLKLHGYDVIEAANGDEALDLCREVGGIDLLLTDVVMPGTSGRALVGEFLALYPEARVLYMSGYTDDAVVRHGVLAGVNFIQKPFALSALLQKVREVLDGPVENMVPCGENLQLKETTVVGSFETRS